MRLDVPSVVLLEKWCRCPFRPELLLPSSFTPERWSKHLVKLALKECLLWQSQYPFSDSWALSWPGDAPPKASQSNQPTPGNHSLSSLSYHPAFDAQPPLGQWSFPSLTHLWAGYIALLCSSHKVHSYQALSFPKLTCFFISCFSLVILPCFPNHLHILFLFPLLCPFP